MCPLSWNKFKIIWTLLCIIGTIVTTLWQLVSYLNNEDVTVVGFKKFHNNEIDVYPDISLCFTVALLEDKLRRYEDVNINSYTYALFLGGYLWNQDMLHINYDNVSFDFKDYVISYGIMNNKWDDTTYYDINSKNNNHAQLPNVRELSVFGMRCITMNIPYKKNEVLLKSHIKLKSSILPGGIRPPMLGDPISTKSLIFALHYPKQSLNQLTFGQSNWPLRGHNSTRNYIIEFNVRGLEISHQRHKLREPCVEGIPEHDHRTIQWIIKKVGCKPPYWETRSNLSLCSKYEEMQEFLHLIVLAFSGDLEKMFDIGNPPCRKMERIQYDMRDIDLPDTAEPTITIMLNYREFTYKEIKSVRNMDLHALVGNII